MANDYYVVKRVPKFLERASPQLLASELEAIEDGFVGLPPKNILAGSAQLLAVEASSSAADVYVLTSEYPISDLVTGLTARFFVTNTNAGESTANVDETGVKDIKDASGAALVAASLVAGRLADLVYNGTHWRLQNSAKAVTVSIALSTALSPQNYERGVAIAPLTLPAATGATAPYLYAASGLPRGLSFDKMTRIVSGTPTVISTSNVSYTVTDANSNSVGFQFQIRVVAELIVLPDPINRTLVVGSDYLFTLLVATGGTAPYFYSVERLPDGMTFDSETREIAGVPNTPNVYNVRLSVRDSGSPVQTETQDFVLTVRSANVLSLHSVADRSFIPGSEITAFTLPSANGGVPAYTYIVTGLGEGLVFNPDTREISGTPSTTGDRAVTYRVEDASGIQVEQSFTVAIETHGARYISTSKDRSISATDLIAGNSYGSAEQELTLPAWVGTRYIAIAQPATLDDLISISLAGLGNSISDFEKQSYTRTIDGILYEIWVGLEVQGDAIAGNVIEVRP